MYDLVIIGGGPAALAAAVFAREKGINAAIVAEELGGKAAPPGARAAQDRELAAHQVVALLLAQVGRAADSVIHDRALSLTTLAGAFRIGTQRHGALEAHTVIVATGARPLALDVAGADRLVEHGLDYSATTFVHLTTGQRVAVIGGAPRALAGAAELARFAARVYVIARGITRPESPLAQILKAHPRVEILEGAQVSAVLGDERVKELLISQNYEPRSLRVDRAFVSLELAPNSSIARSLVETDQRGFIVVDAHQQTSQQGLFAAGDVTTLFGEQTLVAVGDGTRAAMGAYHHLLARWIVARDATCERVETRAEHADPYGKRH